MDKVYIYKDNFLELLTLIDTLVRNNVKPNKIKSSLYNATLFEQLVILEIKKDKDILKKVRNLSGSYTLKIMYYIYLSEHINKELVIYYLYLNSYKYKHNILNMRNLRCVSTGLEIAKYVSREAHRFKGFVRFKQLENNVLYAEIEPTNDILTILAKHFKKRLNGEYWIIKDNKREKVCLYDKKKYYIIDSKNLMIDLKEEDNFYQDLWQDFYKIIGIKERKNDRCRMNFMPKKYWKYIIEVSEEYEKGSNR